ncbi:MAG: mechanosensitive ion channel family protein [Nitrososphaeria archaeon]
MAELEPQYLLMVQQALIAVAIVLAGYVLGWLLEKLLKTTLKKVGLPSAESAVVGSATKYGVTFIAVLMALSEVDVPLTPFLVALAIVGVTIGLASHRLVENAVSGLLLMTYPPFEIGDTITVGKITGEVKELNLLSTTIETDDKRLYSIPNSTVSSSEIHNYSRQGSESQVQFTLRIPYEANLDEATAEILDSISGCHALSRNDPISIHAESFEDRGVKLRVRFFVRDFRQRSSALHHALASILEKNREGSLKLSYGEHVGE